MWSWMKYVYLALRLATLWENLASVKAKNAAEADYQPAAGVVLADPGVQRWLAALPAAAQARFTEALPLFIWGLDQMTE